MFAIQSIILALIVFASGFATAQDLRSGGTATLMLQMNAEQILPPVELRSTLFDPRPNAIVVRYDSEKPLPIRSQLFIDARGLNNNTESLVEFELAPNVQGGIDASELLVPETEKVSPANERGDSGIPGAIVALIFGVFGLLIIGRRKGARYSSSSSILDRSSPVNLP